MTALNAPPTPTRPHRPPTTAADPQPRPGHGPADQRPAAQPHARPEPAAEPLAPAWGWKIPDGGRAVHVSAGPEYQATTTQLCGLYPFVAGSGTPLAGTPVGRHQLWGEVVCLDPLAWLRAGLVTNPGVFVLGQPGTGKIRPGQTAGHRSGRVRHQGPDPRRHQTRLHPARRSSRRPGHPHRPRPGQDQPAGRRAARHRAGTHERPGRRAAALGSALPPPVAADGAGHADPRSPAVQRRGSHPRPRDRPARRTRHAPRPAHRHRRPVGDRDTGRTRCARPPAPTTRPATPTGCATWSSPSTCCAPGRWPGCSTAPPPTRSTWTRPRSASTSPRSRLPGTSC